MNTEMVEVLLIEDNPYEAELAILNFQRNQFGNRLVHIEDGEEALDFIFGTGKYIGNKDRIFNPKLILLDLKLPKVNGIEILEKIRSDPRTKKIPVVVLTSSDQEPDINKCYELGANSYIVKPVNFQDFAKVIADLGFYWILTNKQPS